MGAGAHRLSSMAPGQRPGHTKSVAESALGVAVSVTLLVVSVIVMFEIVKSVNVSLWPGGHENTSGSGGSGGLSVRHAVIWPFLPDENVPLAITGPVTVTLLAASGHCPPLFTQWKVAVPMALAS